MSADTTAPINSIPALAAAVRSTGRGLFAPMANKHLAYKALVPMYRVRNTSLENEVEDAARLVDETSERLRRLATAYGEWPDFDASAYFDLTQKQAEAMVKVTERVSTVHVTFFTDLLLPAFRRAASFWASQFTAAHAAFELDYGQVVSSSRYDDDFLLDTQPVMSARWQRLLTVVEATSHRLADEPGFLGMTARNETQMALRQYWSQKPVRGIAPNLTPKLATIPTLTLSYDFPLPPHRQSGRVRRLRHNRERRRRFNLRDL